MNDSLIARLRTLAYQYPEVTWNGVNQLREAANALEEADRDYEAQVTLATDRYEQMLTAERERDEALRLGIEQSERAAIAERERDEWRAAAAGYGTDAERYKSERDEARQREVAIGFAVRQLDDENATLRAILRRNDD